MIKGSHDAELKGGSEMQELVSNGGDKIQVIKFLGPTAKWYYLFLAFSSASLVYIFHVDHGFLCYYVASNKSIINALSDAIPSVLKTLAEFNRLNPPYVDRCYATMFYAYACISTYLIFLVYLLFLFRHFDRLKSDPMRVLVGWLVLVGLLFIPPTIKADRTGNILVLSFDKYGYFIPQELAWLTVGGFAAAVLTIDLILLIRERMRSFI